MIVTPSEPSPLPEAPSWSIYQSIDDDRLMMPVFIKCSVTGDYSGLAITGAPPAEELAAAWLSIYSEFCNRIGGVQIVSLIQRAKTVNALSSKLDRVTMLVESARLIVCDELITALRADGYKLEDTGDDSAYFRQLDVIMAKLRPERMKLDSLVKELPKADKKQATPQEFNKTLLEISKHEGYPVRAKDVTVAEYCEYVKRLRDHIDHMINQQGNGRRARK